MQASLAQFDQVEIHWLLVLIVKLYIGTIPEPSPRIMRVRVQRKESEREKIIRLTSDRADWPKQV